ncbi:hypothetical protein V1517DRAFT_324746 [Lipomyces orientalis]|uniref:Uncharacterized protein n=1 Tax=Lipomyces orientalis TaxID=1233043 RepID=A0ACC3TLE5_9ASCO
MLTSQLTPFSSIKKHNKHYSFMDESDMYYTALVLDPRVKGNLILEKLREDNNSGRPILQAIRQNLHQQSPLAIAELRFTNCSWTSFFCRQNPDSDVQSRILQRLQA